MKIINTLYKYLARKPRAVIIYFGVNYCVTAHKPHRKRNSWRSTAPCRASAWRHRSSRWTDSGRKSLSPLCRRNSRSSSVPTPRSRRSRLVGTMWLLYLKTCFKRRAFDVVIVTFRSSQNRSVVYGLTACVGSVWVVGSFVFVYVDILQKIRLLGDPGRLA